MVQRAPVIWWEQILKFARATPTTIDIIKRHFLELVSRDGTGRKKRKGRNDQQGVIGMFQSGKHHAVCDCIYTRVPDVMVEIFAGT